MKKTVPVGFSVNEVIVAKAFKKGSAPLTLAHQNLWKSAGVRHTVSYYILFVHLGPLILPIQSMIIHVVALAVSYDQKTTNKKKVGDQRGENAEQKQMDVAESNTSGVSVRMCLLCNSVEEIVRIIET